MAHGTSGGGARPWPAVAALVMVAALTAGCDEDDAAPPPAFAGELAHALVGHTAEVSTVAWSPDGTRLATTSRDETARVWDTATGESIHTLIGGADAAWSPDGTRLATAGRAPTGAPMVWVWNAGPGEQVFRPQRAHEVSAFVVAWSPDGTLVASAGSYESRLWDPDTGAILRTIGEGRPFHASHAMSSLAFSPDGTRLVTGSDDHSARIWDVASGDEIHLLAHHHLVSAVAWSPDGTRLATGSADGATRIWDPETAWPLHILASDDFLARGPEAGATAVAWSPDSTRVAVASRAGEVRSWDAIDGELLHTLTGHTDAVWGLAWSPDGSRLATAGWDGVITVWSAVTGEGTHALTPGTGKPLADVQWSPDGSRLAAAGADGAWIWR